MQICTHMAGEVAETQWRRREVKEWAAEREEAGVADMRSGGQLEVARRGKQGRDGSLAPDTARVARAHRRREEREGRAR